MVDKTGPKLLKNYYGAPEEKGAPIFSVKTFFHLDFFIENETCSMKNMSVLLENKNGKLKMANFISQ